ncbi:probable S-adenosylmethionine-dependent methyltransferase at5g38780 [Phtheirospermum japonicum]|uniref:Probable S-adenosylmethionine-dependent methyltransferase at5g38780 n=1 Tax=Phtheirospermum japonicum TaxID=374723 RepID=A0A830BCW3_9LAMI|nr:probable S-adenosylmethionine-dependent methyltransferase at5g38780 [Phtheirospermum japonicum]
MVIDASKSIVQESITKYIDPLTLETFHIADLGCSTGPNTFTAVDTILQSVKSKYLNTTNKPPEFQVHFLFKSLPPNREYHVSGVPGSFYTRLFPRGSLHVAHSSYSLHWLPQVPTAITDPNSTAYNKGRVHYAFAGDEVADAYTRQHAIEFSRFLEARAQEMVPQGLVMLIIAARPNGVPHSQSSMNMTFDILGSCLVDLAKKGLIEEEKVDGFNLPMYFASPHEFEQVIKQNGRFSIERMESLPIKASDYELISPQALSLIIRAVTEELIRKQFGHEILDQVFDLFTQKCIRAMESNDYVIGSTLDLFILLKLCT